MNDITQHPIQKESAIISLADEAATLNCGRQLAGVLQAGLVIYLYGDLGAGKTTFVRGVLSALGYIGKVKSPTYNLVEIYPIELNTGSSYNMYHYDLYRFIDVHEWEEAGFRETFNPQNICMIEWPEKAQHLLPQPDIAIQFTIVKQTRTIQLFANTPLGMQCLKSF